MKGYKAFDSELKCRSLQYKVGETTTLNGKLEICNNGIHFCEKLSSVFNYYEKSYDTRVCEVEAVSEVVTEGDKSCTLSLKIVRELSKEEIKSLTDDLKFNSGRYNSGYFNSGDNNSGYFNSGDNNSGRYNSGDNNSGHFNSGHYNSGRYNSGYFNSGDNNSGRYNSGHFNSGRYNSGDNNSGYFNTKKSKIRLFNIETDLEFNSDTIQKLDNIIDSYWKPHLVYVYTKDMTDEEKNDNPSHKTTFGFLRKNTEVGIKKSWEKVWNKCTQEEKDFICALPNFDSDIFLEITGIDVTIEQEIEVIVQGVTKTIKKKLAQELGLI